MTHDLKAGDTVTFNPFEILPPTIKARALTGVLLSFVEPGTYINDDGELNPGIWVIRVKSDDPAGDGWLLEVAAERLIGMLQ